MGRGVLFENGHEGLRCGEFCFERMNNIERDVTDLGLEEMYAATERIRWRGMVVPDLGPSGQDLIISWKLYSKTRLTTIARIL